MAASDEFLSNIALIECVKNCSIMWDSRIGEYKDADKRTAKWTELAQKFRLFGVSAGQHALSLSVQYQHGKHCCQLMFTDSNCCQSAVND